MGRWDEWDAIVAAQDKEQQDRLQRLAVRERRRRLHVVMPDETPAEAIAAPEAVLGAPEESWQPAKPPLPPIERAPVDPVTAIRLYVRAIRSMLDRGDQ